ncbi:PIN domain-containing protein [Oribacterium sinus]|uniref:PIN domain-containing protein n=2 Tax=Oribacterium sinus TaxID=237576 RepID=UPI0028D0F65E|nr:PIN domain-containing protein [Oribacterium sinus]
MIFLVDFENTHASGFEGYHYLTEQDTLVVYYSDENSALQKGVVEDLKEKAVHVRMVKLLKQHSNALDMYIASTTGMFLDTGEKICIVSKDKGYAAVRDFWHSLRGAEILLGETIEECFLHSVANDDERIRRAKERNQKVQLIDAFETTNNVPTRPTLSYRNNFRRRKNQFLDVNSHLEPVELLPNPLAKEDVSYASLVEEENDGEHFSVDYSANIKEEKLFPDEEHAESFEKELSSDRAAEETVAANERENPDSQEEAKPADNIKSEEVKHEDSSRSSIETVNRIYLKTEKKANVGRPSNQIQYIYDPVLKRMKRVDVEEAAEDSISETGAEESKKTEEKKSSDAGKDGAVQEDAGAVTESRSTEQRERQRHHNRRRRRSNGKKDNGTQASGQNSNQESSQDNTKAVSQDSAKVEAKDNAKTVAKDYAKTEAKDNSKEHGKDASKEESKSIKEQKPEKQEKVETKEKSGKSDKVVKEKKSARKTGTKASQEKHVEKSAEDSAKASTKEEKKQNQTPEKKAKVKDADKSVESKTDLKTTKEKPLRKSVKAKTGEEKSETKSTRAKTAEKTDKTKAGEKTNTTKEEKTAKTKTGARTSNDKTAEKSVKAKADAKKTESVSAEKPGRRGRKKKEETKETDK